MVIAAALLGALTGIVTGLVPGIHVNTVTALLLAGSASCASLGIEYSALLAFTCALAVSHTFFDVVPGLFLGIPGDETFVLLPGHRLVKAGYGTLAMRLSVWGSVLGLGIGLAVLVALLLLGNLLGAVENIIRPWMFFVLAGVSIVLIAHHPRRGWSLVVFLTSGLLGVLVFGSPLVAGSLDAPVNAMFPALAGLFGVAGLLFAIYTSYTSDPVGPPPPLNASPGVPQADVMWPSARGGLAGLLVGLLPGLGAANAATMLLLFERWFGGGRNRDAQDRAYLVTTSSLNTSEAVFAIAALYLIERSRSGASIAVEQVLGGAVSATDLVWIVLYMAAAGVVAAFIMWRLGARFASWFHAVDANGLNWSVIVFLTALTVLLLDIGGLVILICATVVGLTPLLFRAPRAQLMGFFLVPTMLFYSGQQSRLVDWLSLEQRTAPLSPSVTVSGIVLAIIAACVAAVAVYALTVRVGRSAGQASEMPSPAARMAGRVGAMTGAAAVAGVLLFLRGGAYPRDAESWSAAPPTEQADGRIVRMIDGDTAEIASACRRFRVRLRGVDATELGRSPGDRSRNWAVSALEGRPVTWSAVGVDVYGRFVGDLHFRDGTHVNAEVIRQGYARALTGFAFEDRDEFERLERESRAAGRGLWAEAPAYQSRRGGDPD